MNLFVQLLVNGLVNGADYVLIAVGLSLIFGVLKVVNFAHGGFFLVGAMYAYIAESSFHAPYWLAVIGAIVVSAVSGLLSERIVIRPLLRAPEESVFLSTFGLSLVMLFSVVIALNSQAVSLKGLAGSWHMGSIVLVHQQLLVFVASVIVSGALFVTLRRTRIGNIISAVAQDREVAGSMGLNVQLIFSATFAAAATLAALAGALIVPLSVLSPFSGQTVLLTGFIIVIAAGVESLTGAVCIALLLGLLESFAAGYLSTTAESFVGYILLIAVLLVRPQGVFGQRSERHRHAHLRRVTS